MELLESGDLKERLCEFPTINAIKSILKGIVNGLIYIHTLGIMHRDIKPENILFRKFKKSGKFLSEDERVCIADFGLATFLNEQNNIFEKCGTPGYVAPEILDLKENEICDVSCDVYSLGIIFHLMLLKTCPFDGKTVKEILKKNKNHLIDFNSEMYQHLNSNGNIFLNFLFIYNFFF